MTNDSSQEVGTGPSPSQLYKGLGSEWVTTLAALLPDRADQIKQNTDWAIPRTMRLLLLATAKGIKPDLPWERIFPAYAAALFGESTYLPPVWLPDDELSPADRAIQDIKKQSRARIINTTFSLMKREHLSLHRILSRGRMANKTFHAYFADIDEVVLAVVEERILAPLGLQLE